MKSKTILWLFIGIVLFTILISMLLMALGVNQGAISGGETAFLQIVAVVGVIWYFTARAREKREAKGEKPKKYASVRDAIMNKEIKKKK